MKDNGDDEASKYVRVRRAFLRVMGLAMLAYFAFDLTNALTDFVSAIPTATYMRLLVIPLGFYLITGAYCLAVSQGKIHATGT
jgi:muconolactone delta-isomerase